MKICPFDAWQSRLLYEWNRFTDWHYLVGLNIISNPCSIFTQTLYNLRRHAQCILLSSNCFIFPNNYCSSVALFTPNKDTRAFNEIALVVYWGPIERRTPLWMTVLGRFFLLVSCSSSRPLTEKCQLCGGVCHWSAPPPMYLCHTIPLLKVAIKCFVKTEEPIEICMHKLTIILSSIQNSLKDFIFLNCWLMICIYTIQSESFK